MTQPNLSSTGGDKLLFRGPTGLVLPKNCFVACPPVLRRPRAVRGCWWGEPSFVTGTDFVPVTYGIGTDFTGSSCGL